MAASTTERAAEDRFRAGFFTLGAFVAFATFGAFAALASFACWLRSAFAAVLTRLAVEADFVAAGALAAGFFVSAAAEVVLALCLADFAGAAEAAREPRSVLFFPAGVFFPVAPVPADFVARAAAFAFFPGVVPGAAERALGRALVAETRGATFAAVFFFFLPGDFAGEVFAFRAAASTFRAVPAAGFFAEVLPRGRADEPPDSVGFELRADVFFFEVTAAEGVTRLDVFFLDDEVLRGADLEVFLVATGPEPPGNAVLRLDEPESCRIPAAVIAVNGPWPSSGSGASAADHAQWPASAPIRRYFS